MLRALLLTCLVSTVRAHGAVVVPPPRNAIDKNLHPWNGTVPNPPPNVESMTGWCPVPDKQGNITGQNGQACFWFSNGCAVGCDECDGTSRGPIPNCGKDPTAPCEPQQTPTGTGRNKVGPGVVCAKGNGKKPTICDPALRTVNTAATCGAVDDWFYYSPWRAPGLAPVYDACGMAGGHGPPQGGYGGIYVTTPNAQLGDLGSELPPAPSNTTWLAGATVEVSWTIEANHGGGYQYRLAPAGSSLDEATFARLPLPFVGKQKLRWSGGKAAGGWEISFPGTYATDGTSPAGSMWAKNPIPRNDVRQTGVGFAPPCAAFGMPVEMCSGMMDGHGGAEPSLEIVDSLLLPADLPPGQYVLGWRLDCEESNQIWASCSDVTIASAATSALQPEGHLA